MTFFVGLSMAEIVSAIPTSGGPYFWAAILAPKRHSAFLSWLTGWFNFVGQFAVTTGISFGCAGLIATAATIKGNFVPTPGNTLGIYAAILVSHGLINTFGVHVLKYLNNSSIILHSLGVGSLAIAVVAKAPTHLSASQVFAHFYDVHLSLPCNSKPLLEMHPLNKIRELVIPGGRSGPLRPT